MCRHRLAQIGSGAEEYLCKKSNLWGPEVRYFDRCASGLGMVETEARLDLVRNGECKRRKDAAGLPRMPADWELYWLSQFG